MLSIIHKYRLCPYDRNNPEHEMYLEEVILSPIRSYFIYKTHLFLSI